MKAGLERYSSERDFRTWFAGFGTVLVLAVIWLALFIPWFQEAIILQFDGRPFTELGTNIIPQRRAHEIGMVVLAVLGLAVLFCRSSRIAGRIHSFAGILPYISVLLGLSVAVSSIYWVSTTALPATTATFLYGNV